MALSSYYETLGIGKNASKDEIKKAYRKLAMQHHPDRNKGDKQSEETFKKVNEAYAVLSDEKKRQQYDMFGDQKFHQQYSSEDIFRGTDFGSIFEEFGLGGSFFNQFFTGGGGFQSPGGSSGAYRRGGFQRPPQKGQNVEYPVEVGFMEAYAGSDRQVSFRLSDGTERSLKIKIPKGVSSGTKLRIPGRGAPSPSGGEAGDLFVVIEVSPHPDFTRVGNDIETKVDVKISEALLGGSAQVKTPEGDKRIKIPAGIQPGTKIRLKGLGFAPKSGKAGDLYAVVGIAVPPKLSSQQKSAIETLQGLGL